MSKQAWRIKLEQWLVANGDEGMAEVVDHLRLYTRIAGLIRKAGFKKALEKFLGEWMDFPSLKQDLKEDPVLLRWYAVDPLFLSARDGSRRISMQKDLFARIIDNCFTERGLNKIGVATEKTEVSVYKMAKDATLADMFGSLNPDLHKLCLTQDQIIEFCEKHGNQLRRGSGRMLFLFKQDDFFFVVDVYVQSDGLHVRVHRPDLDNTIWNHLSYYRLAVPTETSAL